jgi:penicillin-binding protein 1A
MAERRPTSVDRKKEKSATKTKKAPKKKSWFKRILLTILFLGLAGILTGVGVFAYYASTAPELDEELLKYPLSSELYDVNGDVFAKLGAENRTFVAYEDIPEEMINAIIATEDVRFFDHFGLDLWRLGGAVVANVRDGYGSQGGSTITQQVVKNSFFKNEKKLKRKAQEAWLAIKLERQYSKEEIFEMYFNRVLMSGTVYGFGTAAEVFYGKELTDLTLSEMAQLAGMPQSPNNYNPFNHPEQAQKRRDIVLSLMVLHEKITQAEADAAKQENIADLVLSEEDRKTNNEMKYPAYVKLVLDELRENGDYDLLTEGVKIYTSLDPDAQKHVENTLNNAENFPTDSIQAGMAVVDTKTGAIAAVGGGRNYGTDLLFNRATDVGKRSPGSTAKPIVAYGPAIEYLKWSTGETTVDEKMTYPNSKQVISNFDGQYKGTMTIREALYTSRNVPAVKTLLEVGTDKSKDFITRLGVEIDEVYPSTTLGPNLHITPIQMAAAYAAFGNNGVFTDAHAITKIVYRDGSQNDSYAPKSSVAMSDYTAYMVTDILRDTVSTLPNASGASAMISGVDIAGKTGTSNYSAEDFTKYNLGKSAVPDSWFAGYTSDYSIAIWTGYDDYGTPITTTPERKLAQSLFKSVMTKIVNDIGKPAAFKKPSSVVEATIEVGSKPLQLASQFTPADKKRTELFVKGTQPTKVSAQYDGPTIGALSGLAATASGNNISLSWGYTPAEGEEATEFEVAVSIDGGESKVLTTTSAKSYAVSGAEVGKTYKFTVTPIVSGEKGTSASTSILFQPSTPSETEDDEEQDENTDENNGSNSSNNGTNNGSTNNGSNNGSTNNGNSNNGRPNTSTPPATGGGTPGTGGNTGTGGSGNNNTGGSSSDSSSDEQ